jgi:hypothetical protein
MLMGLALSLGIVAIASDELGGSHWWAPVAATAFTAAFIGCIADAYRTGLVTGKSKDFDRREAPVLFVATVVFLGAMAVFCAFVALGLWSPLVPRFLR